MCQSKTKWPLTVVNKVEELANVITHGMFIPTSLYCLYKFCMLSKRDADLLNAYVYGIGLIVLFSVSTLYHCSHFTNYKTVTEYLRISDHATIYLFIAVSYTPWVTIAGYDIDPTHYVVPIWTIALFGIVFSFYTKGLVHTEFELLMYVAEALVPALCLAFQIGFQPELYQLAIGGFFFLSGIVFFKLDGYLPFAHAIWHIFVFLGTYYHSKAFIDLLIKNGNGLLHSQLA